MLISTGGSEFAEVAEITPLARFIRVFAALAVLMVFAVFCAQWAFHSFELATPGDVDNLGARDLAWVFTGIALLLALPARVWRACQSPGRERFMWWLRGGIAVSALGIVLDIVFDFFISFLVLDAGLGRLFAWSGFLAFCLSIVAGPTALVVGCKKARNSGP